MADITPTEITQDPEGNIKGWKWASVTESDVCLPVRFSDKDDMTLSDMGPWTERRGPCGSLVTRTP